MKIDVTVRCRLRCRSNHFMTLKKKDTERMRPKNYDSLDGWPKNRMENQAMRIFLRTTVFENIVGFFLTGR